MRENKEIFKRIQSHTATKTLVVMILVGLFLISLMPVSADDEFSSLSSKYEYFDEATGPGSEIYSLWEAQTFTRGYQSIPRTIQLVGVSLNLTRVGAAAGSETQVCIFDVNETIAPVNNLGCNDTTDFSGITTSDGGEWMNITMPSITLVNQTPYALVVRDVGNNPAVSMVRWNTKGAPGYLNGSVQRALVNGTGGWRPVALDNAFMIWGRSIIVGDMVENSQDYNLTTYETEPESFTINLTYGDSTYSDVSSYLVYNNTRYLGTKYGGAGEVRFDRAITVPTVTGRINMTFYWELGLIDRDTGDTIYGNSSFNNQTVNSILLQKCNSTVNISYINFSMRDERTDDFVDATIDLTFTYWTGTGDDKENYSFSNSSGYHYYDFCVFPAYKTINTDLELEYDAISYQPRTYYLDGATLTNETNNINLYLLNDTYYTKFFLTLTQSLQPVKGATVTISKYYTGEGIYKTIGKRVTDDRGEFIEYLEIDKKYQFTVVKSGAALGTIEKTAQCSSVPCEMDLDLEAAVIDLWAAYYDVVAPSVAYNLSYNATIKIISFTYADLTGLAQHARLRVNQVAYNQSGLIICNTTLYSTAGTITCNLTGYYGDFRAIGYISRSPEMVAALIDIFASAIREILGAEGLLFTLIAIVTIGFVGAYSAVAGIFLIALAFFLSKILGFASFSYTAVILVIVLAIITIIKMGRRV